MTQAETVLEELDSIFDQVFAQLNWWVPRIQELLTPRIHPGQLSGAHLAGLLEQDVHALLSSTAIPMYGAGFCATAEMVSDGNPLAWWQGPERSLLASSTFGPGQAAIDLQRLEWFRVPAETGEPHVAGPFVDYLCSNEITVTLAVPVELGGMFAGVACADIVVAALEERLSRGLQDIPNRVLLNSNGRVVLSSDPDFETGDRYRALAFTGNSASLDACPNLTHSQRYPFSIATL